MSPPRTPVAIAPTGLQANDSTPVANQLQFIERPNAIVPAQWSVDFARPCLNPSAEGTYSVSLRGSFDVPGYSLFLRYDGYLAHPIPRLGTATEGAPAESFELPLAKLMDEWGTLTEGKHRLVVFAAGDADKSTPETTTGLPALSICDIEVSNGKPTDVTVSEAAAQPRVVLTSPEGTLHGDLAADSAALQLFVVPKARAATLVIERPDGGQDRHQLESGTYTIHGLKNGDYELSAGFVAADGFASGGLWTPHTITVNRDAK